MQTDLISALPGRKKLSLTVEIGNHWCTLRFPPGKGNESEDRKGRRKEK